MFLTRWAKGSMVIQATDPDRGLAIARAVGAARREAAAQDDPKISFNYSRPKDVAASPLVAAIIEAYEEYGHA